MSEDWISAAEAFRLVSEVTGASEARRTICNRAHDGLIKARAKRMIFDRDTYDDADVPQAFWWNLGDSNLEQNWNTGDFATWYTDNAGEWNESALHFRVYGVSFARSGIEALIGPAVPSRDATPSSLVAAGGRPAAAWWDDLWIEVCRQIYCGYLKPEKQADIESAMMNWAAAHGQNPALSTIRARARKLRIALSKKDEN